MDKLAKYLGSNTSSKVATLSAIVYEAVDIYTKYQSGALNGSAIVQCISLLVLGFVTNEISPTTIYQNRKGGKY